MLENVADLELYGCLRYRHRAVGFEHHDAIVIESEEGPVTPDLLAHEQLEARLGRFELEAFILQLLNFLQYFAKRGLVVFEIEFFPGLGGDVAHAGELADEDSSGISDGFGGNVLISG